MEQKRFFTIRKEMDEAFKSKRLTDASRIAIEYLELAKSNSSSWNYGNAIHHANLMLGMIAFQNEKIESAKVYLLKAGKTPGSPQLNSFGPNMQLANELLKIGEKEIVLQYLHFAEDFWVKKFNKTSVWKEQIHQGIIPKFGPNLLY